VQNSEALAPFYGNVTHNLTEYAQTGSLSEVKGVCRFNFNPSSWWTIEQWEWSWAFYCLL